MFTNIFTITKLLVTLSIIPLIIAVLSIYSSWSTMFWPSTNGVIQFTVKQNKGSITSHKNPVMTTESTIMSYSFVVNGESYSGYTPYAMRTKNKEKEEVLIYYNPNNPNQSTIYYGVNWVYFILLFSISIIIGFAAFKWHRHTKP